MIDNTYLKMSKRQQLTHSATATAHVTSHDCSLTTGCPKKKLALGKLLEIPTHGFKMCILYVKRDKLGPNPSKLKSTQNCQIS